MTKATVSSVTVETNAPDADADDMIGNLTSHLGRTLPRPVGWKLLVAVPDAEKTTEGGIILPDIVHERERNASVAGMVVAMGPQCYKGNEAKYGPDPWCKVGDWVNIRAYSGTRFQWRNQLFLFINDDTIEGVVDDPREVRRV